MSVSQFKIADVGTRCDVQSKCFPRQVSDILTNDAPFIEVSLGLMRLISLCLMLEKYNYTDCTASMEL